jgi:hypothetical protein
MKSTKIYKYLNNCDGQEDVVIEMILQLLVAIVDQELFKTIVFECLKTKYVQYGNEHISFSGTLII